jgi:DNA polymerase V
MTQLFAHVDANAFYVSVERLYDPAIRQRPVIVLSAGDGCVVAADTEAKALGIKRGTPYFQIRTLVEQHAVAVYRCNFALYQEASDRLMRVLATFATDGRFEPYSIDESFFDVSHVPPETLRDYGRTICETVWGMTRLPVTVGFGTTKLLAKLATRLGKRDPERQGVMDLVAISAAERDALLDRVSVEDLWGIGAKSSAKLQLRGILTAKALRDADPARIHRLLSVVGERLVYELRGVSCLPLELVPKPKKGIMVAHSFGRDVEALAELQEAVCHYAAKATEKLRRQGSSAGYVSVFMHTNPHSDGPQYANSAATTLPFPSAFPPDFFPLVTGLLNGLYRSGYRYRRVGVYLGRIQPQAVMQEDLFGAFSVAHVARQRRVMLAVDALNAVMGRETLFFAAQGVVRDWQTKPRRLSPRYSTQWQEVVAVL